MSHVFLPGSLAELWHTLEDHPEASVYAGGTDLLVKMRSGLLNPASLICLDRLEELKGISRQEDGIIRIGSCTTHTQILADPRVRSHLSILGQAIEGLGSPPIRNMGTIGGNICTASPAGDTLPPLYVLDAEVELCREDGVRRMPVRKFIVGPGVTLLERGEILSAVWIKKPEGYNVHHFEKVGLRNALACSIASLTALLRVSADGVIEKAALAWGSVSPTVFTCPEAENVLIGERLSLKRLQEAAAIVRNGVRPITDLRAEADYRRIISGNLLLRLIKWS
jgi:CO/xanthine dehydrogenase FAD-binding subunit